MVDVPQNGWQAIYPPSQPSPLSPFAPLTNLVGFLQVCEVSVLGIGPLRSK